MIWIILILALGLRLIASNQSLWLDEAVNVVASTQYSLGDFITKYPLGDFHPPGYFLILWIWTHIFGTSEIVVRLPSILLGVGTVYLIYLIGKKIFDKNIGLTAALILALSPLHIYYSQEARMYSLATFAVCCSFYWLVNLLENPRSKKFLAFYALSIILVLYSDYVAYLILPVHLLGGFFQKRQAIKKVFFGQLIGVLGLLPWLFIFPAQLIHGSQLAKEVPGWKNVVGGTGIKDVGLIFVKILIGRISFDNKIIYGAVVGGVVAFYGAVLYPLLREKRCLLIFAWFLIPIILAFMTSFFVPILSYFRLLFIVPAFVLLLSLGIDKISKIWRFWVLTLVVLINIAFSAVYLFNPKFQREDWKNMVQFLDSVSNPSSIVLLENNNLPAPFLYYYRHQIDTEAALSHFPTRSNADVINLDELLQSKTKVYLVDYLVDISDPQREVAKRLENVGFHQNRIDNFNGVGFVYEYSK